MRVVVLGEFRADRLVSPLQRAGADIVVLGFVELETFLGPDIVCGILPADLTDDALRSILDHYGADIAIPNPGLIGQERMLPVYARVARGHNTAGRHLPAHSPEFAVLATDKVELHRTAVRRGWPVPAGAVCEEPSRLLDATAAGLPALVKEARSESHAGRYYVTDEEDLQRVARTVAYPVLFQQALAGEEFGVELFSGPTRSTAWPVASLGPLDSGCNPGCRIRVAPATLPDRARCALGTAIRDIAAAYRPAGPWQIDFALTPQGHVRLIEVNGRFGGMSNMSWASTGVDPHGVHVAAALGTFPRTSPLAKRVALELPIANDISLPAPPAGIGLKAFRGNPANRGPCTSGFHRAVLQVPEERAQAARAWLLGLPSDALPEPTTAAAQLAVGISSLTRGQTLLP